MAVDGRYHRTIEDVKTVIHHAKLADSDLKPLTQVLFVAAGDEYEDRYKFLELDSTLINTLHRGQSLIFRGSDDENAVLCTHDKTYYVREAETSNSLLLFQDLKWPADAETYTERTLQKKQVLGVYHKYLEPRLCKPKLKKLRQMLEKSQYRGPEHEDDLLKGGVKLYTYHDLLENVQASEQELKKELSETMAFRINGYWRFLEHEYHFRVLSHILNFVEENSWPLDKVNRVKTLQALAVLIPVDILEQCFLWYTEDTGKVDEDGEPYYKLIESKVCRFLAKVLLLPAGKFNLKDFFSSWQQSVPEGMKTSEKYLEGMALMDRSSKPEVIWYYPECDLPEEIIERIRLLFQAREKWTFDEIRPYVQRLATEKMNVNALLTKYARASNIGGVRYYCAKHAK